MQIDGAIDVRYGMLEWYLLDWVYIYHKSASLIHDVLESFVEANNQIYSLAVFNSKTLGQPATPLPLVA